MSGAAGTSPDTSIMDSKLDDSHLLIETIRDIFDHVYRTHHGCDPHGQSVLPASLLKPAFAEFATRDPCILEDRILVGSYHLIWQLEQSRCGRLSAGMVLSCQLQHIARTASEHLKTSEVGPLPVAFVSGKGLQDLRQEPFRGAPPTYDDRIDVLRGCGSH